VVGEFSGRATLRGQGRTDDGAWDRVLVEAQVYDDDQPIYWVISVDPSVVRAHQQLLEPA
jgi:hypothetical protein